MRSVTLSAVFRPKCRNHFDHDMNSAYLEVLPDNYEIKNMVSFIHMQEVEEIIEA